MSKQARKTITVGGKAFTLDREYTSKWDFAEQRAADLRKEGYNTRVILYDRGKYKAVYKRKR